MHRKLLALMLLALPAGRIFSQELIAWPIGSSNPGLRSIFPGQPIFNPRPEPIPFLPSPQPRPLPGTTLSLSGYKVAGKIEGPAADISLDVVFHNPSPQRMEGVLVVPLPADTVLSGFTMTAGGKTMKAELLESGQAASVYENIVRQLRDPALLELVGERMLRARVFPIEPNGDISVHVGWTQIARQSGGLASLSLPMRSARLLQNGAHASATIELSADRPLRTLYSPVSEVKIERQGDRKAILRYEPSSPEAQDLSLLYSTAADPLGVGLLTHKTEGEDGFFLLTVSPKLEPAAPAAAIAKDILFVLDRSGSMSDDGKIDQAKKAVAFCLGKLGPKDRFGIVDFATDASTFEDRLLSASPENVARAKRYVERIDAAGGTNIDAALQTGSRLLSRGEGRVSMVFFLTDGLPTVGETDMNRLLAGFSSRNSNLRARVFTFGVGSDVNTLFLDKLAEGNRGAHDYVLPGETIENKISSLYQKVGHPALTDVTIEWKGVEAGQVYPRPIPDLFYGSELVLMGRTLSDGRGTLVIQGHQGARAVRFEFPVDFPRSEARNDFLPRLWANFKVGHELDAVRLSGNPDPEVVKDIVRLAKRYGIVTPYTSFLITEEGKEMPQAINLGLRRIQNMQVDASQSGISGGAVRAMEAQKASKMLSSLSGTSFDRTGGLAGPSMADALKKADQDAREEISAKGGTATRTRQAGDKTFYLRGDAWIDGEVEFLESKADTVEIRAWSPEYFQLLAKIPALSRYLAVGSNVSFLHGGTVYRIVDK